MQKTQTAAQTNITTEDAVKVHILATNKSAAHPHQRKYNICVNLACRLKHFETFAEMLVTPKGAIILTPPSCQHLFRSFMLCGTGGLRYAEEVPASLFLVPNISNIWKPQSFKDSIKTKCHFIVCVRDSLLFPLISCIKISNLNHWPKYLL